MLRIETRIVFYPDRAIKIDDTVITDSSTYFDGWSELTADNIGFIFRTHERKIMMLKTSCDTVLELN